MRNDPPTKALAGLLAALLPVTAVMGVPDAKFAFTSIEAVGTNLLLRATVPAGLENLTLETRPDLDSPWQVTDIRELANFGNEFSFTISKPAGMQLLRLRATEIPGAANSSSAPINYVTMPPLISAAPHSAQIDEAVLHFRARVDGSDKMLVNRQGVLWEHVNWGWPDGVVILNGVKWNPAEINYATTPGRDEFLPRPFAFASATLEIIKARDVVALEQRPDGLLVYLNDTPSGADDYEFKIHFHTPGPPATPSTPATLKILATIDGSDALTITPTEAHWEHFYYSPPTDVSLNGIAWRPAERAVLKNEAPTSFLPAGVDLSSAKITGRKGRDLATLWATDKEIKIHFADNPNGADTYELTISFGQ